MEFLQAQIPFPKSTTDYRKIIFMFDVNHVYPIDQMDLHRKSGEMLLSTLTITAMSLSKLRIALSNVQSQLKIEKPSSLAKDNKLKCLEDIVIKIGYDPQYCKAIEQVLHKRNIDITTLKK